MRENKVMIDNYADFGSILVWGDNGRQNLLLYKQTSKEISLAVMTMDQYVLMIRLVSFSKNTQAKVHFAILL